MLRPVPPGCRPLPGSLVLVPEGSLSPWKAVRSWRGGGGWLEGAPVRWRSFCSQGFSVRPHPKVTVLDSVEKVVLSVSGMLRCQPVTSLQSIVYPQFNSLLK